MFKYDDEKSPILLSAYLSNQYDGISVEKVPGLRGNREDHDSLKILLTDPDVTIYFLSVNSQEFTLKSEVAVFPLVISVGLEKIVENVLLMVERLFDCVIYPLHLTSIDLKWMSALWCGQANSEATDQVVFSYVGAQESPLDITFDGRQIRSFWKKYGALSM